MYAISPRTNSLLFMVGVSCFGVGFQAAFMVRKPRASRGDTSYLMQAALAAAKMVRRATSGRFARGAVRGGCVWQKILRKPNVNTHWVEKG